MKRIRNKNALWFDMAEKHRNPSRLSPFHVLLMGGDQVYADSMWETVKLIKDWASKSRKQQVAARFTSSMQDKVEEFYFSLYRDRWSQLEPADMLASIPTVMMWDDHDIFDGWGSYPKELQNCDVYQGIYQVARRYFQAFQLQIPPDEPHPMSLLDHGSQNLSMGFDLQTMALLVLDMRSERTLDTVMRDESWNAVEEWMQGQNYKKHLVIMASIPVVHPDFGLMESVLGFLPGQQELEDDLKDHWTSRTHKTERLRFIHRLLRFAREKNCRVTLISGDVHVGATGIIESKRVPDADRNSQVINQLTSSGIVHPAPPGIALFFLEKTGDAVEEVDRDVIARMLEFPGTRQRFISGRNWLGLEGDKKDRLWACWYLEPDIAGISQPPYTKVIHPCG